MAPRPPMLDGGQGRSTDDVASDGRWIAGWVLCLAVFWLVLWCACRWGAK